jgi:uncharacterized protein YecE (DUF72 family)
MKPADFLSFYADRFKTVEVDSTFYGTPSPQTVKSRASKTPAGFIFSVKIPQVSTHEKVLLDCAAEFQHSLWHAKGLPDTLECLGVCSPRMPLIPLGDRAL